ncbi:PH domain-containing protein [Rickettsiales bacterium]|nr:PH domain-containing protein [Rickettsiales bacterium]
MVHLLDQEKVVYRGGPSQWVNSNIFTIDMILFLLAMTLPWFWKQFFAASYPDLKGVYMGAAKIAFFLPLIHAGWVWAKTYCHKYVLTTERLHEESGVFSRQTDVLELFRVKDMTLVEPFALRMFGCGNIVLDTSDKSTPIVVMYAVKDTKPLLDTIRKHVEIMRVKKGVREID